MVVSTRYSIQRPVGDTLEEGAGTASLTGAGLMLERDGSVYQFDYRDLAEVVANDYSVTVSIEPNTAVVLSKLGRRYEDFVRELHGRRNEVLIEDMLIDEPLRQGGYEADLEYIASAQETTVQASCEVRLYETAIVFLPRSSLPIRLPFGLVTTVEAEDYAVRIETDSGETATLSKLGRQFEPFRRDLNEALSDLTVATLDMLDDRLTEADPITLNRLAERMRDGRAVSRHEIEDVAGSDIWAALIESLDTAGIGEQYRYLTAKAVDDWISVGIKRGLMGDLTGDYLWFLMPVADVDDAEAGNAVVMEGAGADTGRATYLFQITSPDDYAAITDRDSLDRVVAETVHDLNHAMLAINFRREPIYLPRERLSEPRYASYRSALKLVPALTKLRDAFLGRVSHRSAEQWRRDVDELLRSATEDGTVGSTAASEAREHVPVPDSEGEV